MPLASIIIPVHNGAAFLRRCLDAVLPQLPLAASVIAVDNGSSDGSATLLARHYPQVHVIESAESLGFAGAVNTGIRAALGLLSRPEYVVLLNQDTQVDPGWLQALLHPFSGPKIGVVGSLARFPNGQIQHAGAELIWPRWYGRNLQGSGVGGQGSGEQWETRHKTQDTRHKTERDEAAFKYGLDHSTFNIQHSTFFISGLALALRVAMLDEIGLFDEAYFPAYFEDADLCLRAVAAGWQLHMAYDATLIHAEGASQARSYAHAAQLERGRIRTMLKHQQPELILGPFFEAEYAAAQEAAQAGLAQALRQAYLSGLLALPQIAKQRGLADQQRREIAGMLVELRDVGVGGQGSGAVGRGAGAGGRDAKSCVSTIDIDVEHKIAPIPPLSLGMPQSIAQPQSFQEQESLTPASGALSDQKKENTLALDVGSPTLPAMLPSGDHSAFSIQHSTLVASDAHSAFNIQHSTFVTIVMLTWNGLDYTRACIESIRHHDAGVAFRLLVIDNGSTDGTREWLRAQPDLMLIENETNLGFTRGNNQGMAAAEPGSDLLLLNNDTLVMQAGWLGRLHEVAHSQAKIGIVGCLLLHTNGLLQHAGTFMPTNSYWGYQIGGGEGYVGQYPGVREVEGITGACMYIRRDVYEQIGGLDSDYFSYFEDTDYCLKAQAAGYKVVCVGDVKLTHHENTSSKINNSDWRAMFSAGQQRFMSKWRTTLEQRYTRGLLWHSLIATPTGYGTSSREFVRELDRRNVDVRTACIFGTDYTEPATGDPRVDQLQSRPKDLSLPQVVYSQADAFVKNSGHYRIGFSMLEANGLPEDWVFQANQMDEIWTPTRWGANVFATSGVKRPIHVIPLGFNPDYFHPGIVTKRVSQRYTFLSVFDWIERKAPDILIRAYLRAFTANDEVLLLLKVSNHDPYVNVERQIRELSGSGPTAPIAVMLNQKIADTQMGSLYRSADCFVLPTRGEGWGMPTLEAMACGLPVISTDWGAQTAFLNEQTAFPLRIRGLTAAVARSPYYAGLAWAKPDEEYLVELMRYVYQNHELARKRGEQAAAIVHNQWTWARATDAIMARLEEIGGEGVKG